MANFNFKPRIVNRSTPDLNIKSTQMESFKKEYDQISSDILYIYELEFIGIRGTDRDAIYEHWLGQTGPLDDFWWTTSTDGTGTTSSVPSYIWSGQLHVRYMEGDAGYEEQAKRDANGEIYDVTVRFRREP